MVTKTREFMTPERAAEILKNQNKRNRCLNTELARHYSRLIESGLLAETEIAFYIDGLLGDGQHRLKGIVISGIGIWVWVSRGWPQNTVWDRHRPRSVADTIRTTGVADWVTKRDTPIATKMTAMITRTRNRVSEQQQGELCNLWRPAIEFASMNLPTNERGTGTASIRASLAAASYAEDHALLARFCSVLKGDVPQGRHESAALRLRDWCLRQGNASSGNTTVSLTMKRTQNAIRHFCAGRDIKVLYCPEEYIYAYAIPRPSWLNATGEGGE